MCIPLNQQSSAVSQILVEKLGAMAYVSPLLKSPNPSLQKTAMSVIGNFSQTSSLQTSLGKQKYEMLSWCLSFCNCRQTWWSYAFFFFFAAKQVLPDLTRVLSSGPQDMGNCDETLATACNTMRVLASADTDVNKKVITKELVQTLADLSENRQVN